MPFNYQTAFPAHFVALSTEMRSVEKHSEAVGDSGTDREFRLDTKQISR